MNSDHLFELIRSLNKAEKKHFKLYASYYSRNVNDAAYLRLFDLLEKQREYNEAQVLEQGIVSKKRLRALRHYLYNLVLESLQALRSKSTDVDNKLNGLLSNSRILLDKGIENEEMRFYVRAKKTALQQERWGAALSVLLAERKALLRMQDFKSLDNVTAEIDDLFSKLNNLKEYMELNQRVFSSILKAGTVRTRGKSELENFVKHPLLARPQRALSLEARVIRLDTLYGYYTFREDFRSAYSILKQQLEIVEGSGVEFSTLTHAVILNNLTIIQQHFGKYDEALATIHRHRQLVWSSKKTRMQHLLYTYINETNLYIVSGGFEKAAVPLQDIIAYVESARPEFTWQLNLLYYNIAYLLFGNGRYREALRWATSIINHPKMIYREDIQTAARLLQILSHYELNTRDVLEHLLPSTYRHLVTRKHRYKAEEHFLRFLEKTRTYTDKKELHAEFTAFRKKLLQLTKDPEEKKLLEYFDLTAWIRSKTEDKPFAEMVRKKG